jgi:hypothetical protein
MHCGSRSAGGCLRAPYAPPCRSGAIRVRAHARHLSAGRHVCAIMPGRASRATSALQSPRMDVFSGWGSLQRQSGYPWLMPLHEHWQNGCISR